MRDSLKLVRATGGLLAFLIFTDGCSRQTQQARIPPKPEAVTTASPLPPLEPPAPAEHSYTREALLRAFNVAFQLDGSTSAVIEGDEVTKTYEPQQLVPLGDLTALLSTGIDKADEGSFGPQPSKSLRIDYLREKDGQFSLLKRWPEIGAKDSAISPSSWSIRYDLFSGPGLEIVSAETQQGITSGFETIYELTADGPKIRMANIPLNQAADAPINGPDKRIESIRRDDSFRIVLDRKSNKAVIMRKASGIYKIEKGSLPSTLH